MGSLAETLSVVIGANADPLVKELQRASREVNRWGREVQGNLDRIGDAANMLNTMMQGLAIGGIGMLIKSITDAGAELLDHAENLGLTVERYQELRFAAQQAGASSDQFATGMERLSRLMGDAIKGNGGEAIKALQTWGVVTNQAELKSLSYEDVLARIENRFSTITDPQLRAAAATDLLGKNMLDMADFLRQGNPQIEQTAAKAKELGVVLDEDTAQRAKEAKIALEQTGDIIKVNLMTAIVDILPDAKEFASVLQTIARVANTINTNLSDNPGLASIPTLNKKISDVDAQIEEMKRLQATEPESVSVDDNGAERYSGAFGISEKITELEQYKTALIELRDAKIENNRIVHNRDQTKLNPVMSGNITRNLVAEEAGQKEQNRLLKAQETIDNYLAKLEQENQLLDLNKNKRAEARAVFELEAISKRENIQLTQQEIDTVRSLSASIEAKKAIEEQEREQLAEAKQFSNQLAASLSSAFEEAAIEGKKFGEVLGSLLQDIEKMIIRAAVLKPISDFITGGSDDNGIGLWGQLKSFLPGFAGGGTINGPAIVGERGFELWVPPVPGGTIIPNRDLMRAGGGAASSPQFNFNVSVSGPAAGDPRQAASAGAAFAQAAKATILQIITDQQRIGGSLHGTSRV